jgi:restriction system protein
MGGISFGPQRLPDILSETAGYKAGLTLSVEQMCDLFSGTKIPDLIRQAELTGVRLRSEEYEELFYSLLYRIGFTENEYGGYAFESARLFHKYKDKHAKLNFAVGSLFIKMWPGLLDTAAKANTKGIDPIPLLFEAKKRHGNLGVKMMWERIDLMDRSLRLSPHSTQRYEEWKSVISLDGLFDGKSPQADVGMYIDQRYINFLFKNPEKLASMHWRKFEELTTEFFHREGFQVELGPGGNDDGVDVRVWDANETVSNPPLCIIQCKRTNSNVEKIIVKGLYADVVHNKAKKGLIVTTSELSPGARTTITSRGYPIEEVNRNGVVEWLTKLRVVGTGIVRI